jgi:hypothetical protein
VSGRSFNCSVIQISANLDQRARRVFLMRDMTEIFNRNKQSICHGSVPGELGIASIHDAFGARPLEKTVDRNGETQTLTLNQNYVSGETPQALIARRAIHSLHWQ